MAQRTARAAAPRDRFDDVPADLVRVGAHRAPVRRRGIVTFGWAALATGVLVGAGVLGLQVIEGGVRGPETTASTTVDAGPVPTVDPQAQVVVLNGTTTGGLAAAASATAQGDGWDVRSAANADTQDFERSTVYYSEDDQLGAARGLARSLGIARAPQQSDRFAVEGESRLTVVLGGDYPGAG